MGTQGIPRVFGTFEQKGSLIENKNRRRRFRNETQSTWTFESIWAVFVANTRPQKTLPKQDAKFVGIARTGRFENENRGRFHNKTQSFWTFHKVCFWRYKRACGMFLGNDMLRNFKLCVIFKSESACGKISYLTMLIICLTIQERHLAGRKAPVAGSVTSQSL